MAKNTEDAKYIGKGLGSNTRAPCGKPFVSCKVPLGRTEGLSHWEPRCARGRSLCRDANTEGRCSSALKNPWPRQRLEPQAELGTKRWPQSLMCPIGHRQELLDCSEFSCLQLWDQNLIGLLKNNQLLAVPISQRRAWKHRERKRPAKAHSAS